MSKISTVYDGLFTAVSGLFTGANVKTRIPQPESLEDNPVHIMRNGYGIIYGGASLVDGEFHTLVLEHTFSIILTRELMRTESQTTRIDTVHKALLEDAVTIMLDLYNVDKFGMGSSLRVNNLGLTSPIEFVAGDKLNFRTLSIDALLQIDEDIC